MDARGKQTWCGACEAVELWPENVASVDLFLAVETQWRVGMGGATGLDYAGVRAAMLLRNEPPRRFDDIQLMEREYLVIMNQKQAKTAATAGTPRPSTREKISHG